MLKSELQNGMDCMLDNCARLTEENLQLRHKLEAAEAENKEYAKQHEKDTKTIFKIAKERDEFESAFREAREQKPFGHVIKEKGSPCEFVTQNTIPVGCHTVYAAPVPAMPVQDDKWVQIDSEFLQNKPEWFHGDLWVSFCCEKPVLGKYEWRQGWSPDRIITECGNDYCAAGIWVMPAVIPEPPQSEVKPSC